MAKKQKIYLVTEKKLEENLGKGYQRYCRSSKWILVAQLLTFVFVPLNILIVQQFRQFCGKFSCLYPFVSIYGMVFFPTAIIITYFFFLLLIVALPFVMYFLLRHQYLQEISENMRVLVNDPQLLWLNFNKEAVYSTDKKPVLKRYNYPLGEEAFYVMGYLKKHGTSSGLSWKNWKNTGTVRKRLQQLATRGIICESGSDYAYLPWGFRLIDEYGKFVEMPKVQETEKMLNTAWARMLDGTQEKI